MDFDIIEPLRKVTDVKKIYCALIAGLLIAPPAYSADSDAEAGRSPEEPNISGDSFRCLSDMTPVRGFFVDNLLGDIEATVAVASSPDGGVYPPGSVVQLVPAEVMVKREAGWSAETNDWEFFELEVSATGSAISVRGTTEAVNRFGGNCLDCHQLAEPEWDMICEQDHGCAPLPFTREQIVAVQASDPRCVKAE